MLVQRVRPELVINHLHFDFLFYVINIFFWVHQWPTLAFRKYDTNVCLEFQIVAREDVVTESEVSF